MNIGRFRNYQCFTSLRKITIPLKKWWSMKRWILKWPCRRGLFFHPHLHHTSFDSRRFVGTHCAWGQLETKETLVDFFWESEKKLYPLLFFLFSLQQKPNSTSLPAFQKMFSERLQEAVAGLVWLARRLGLHHQGDCFTKIRLKASKLQSFKGGMITSFMTAEFRYFRSHESDKACSKVLTRPVATGLVRRNMPLLAGLGEGRSAVRSSWCVVFQEQFEWKNM